MNDVDSEDNSDDDNTDDTEILIICVIFEFPWQRSLLFQ